MFSKKVLIEELIKKIDSRLPSNISLTFFNDLNTSNLGINFKITDLLEEIETEEGKVYKYSIINTKEKTSFKALEKDLLGKQAIIRSGKKDIKCEILDFGMISFNKDFIVLNIPDLAGLEGEVEDQNYIFVKTKPITINSNKRIKAKAEGSLLEFHINIKNDKTGLIVEDYEDLLKQVIFSDFEMVIPILIDEEMYDIRVQNDFTSFDVIESTTNMQKRIVKMTILYYVNYRSEENNGSSS